MYSKFTGYSIIKVRCFGSGATAGPLSTIESVPRGPSNQVGTRVSYLMATPSRHENSKQEAPPSSYFARFVQVFLVDATPDLGAQLWSLQHVKQEGATVVNIYSFLLNNRYPAVLQAVEFRVPPASKLLPLSVAVGERDIGHRESKSRQACVWPCNIDTGWTKYAIASASGEIRILAADNARDLHIDTGQKEHLGRVHSAPSIQDRSTAKSTERLPMWRARAQDKVARSFCADRLSFTIGLLAVERRQVFVVG